MTVPSWCEDLDARSERHSAVHGGLRTSDHPRSALPRITPSGFADVVTVTAAQQSRIHTGFLRPHQGRTIQTHGGYQGPSFHAAQPRQRTGPQNRLGPRVCGAKSYTVTARCPLPIASEPSSTVMQTLRESMPLDAKASGRVVTAQIVESTIRHAR